MGLSTSERMGCRRILQQLDTSDLDSLYKTVSKTKTAYYLKADLIEKIIEASKTATELLNRKKVYKDQIVQYLNSECISIPTKITKEEAIQKSIEHWRKSEISITVKPKAAEKRPTNSRQLQNVTSDIDLGQLSFQIHSLSIHNNQEDSNKVEKAKLLTMLDAQSAAALKTRLEGDKMSGALGSSSKINLLKMDNVARQIEEVIKGTNPLLLAAGSGLGMSPGFGKNPDSDQTFRVGMVKTEYKLSGHSPVKQEQEDIGEEFCRWFYIDMLPQLKHMTIITDWAATVFYENVTIHCICTIGERKNIQGEGADMASWIFSDFIRHARLTFNYNDHGGIRSYLNDHGILTVEVSGTVHKEKSFLGLFKHKYKLTKRPDNGEFKITNADLRIGK
ncbi:uncharacterized protein C3orf38 homolog [Rana temporaria]|uniref:uncharacterized protein C3orf38 homolog n=1 Tax=Rana temporaria TaxID=8407 RepID=UPI001AAD84F3|nr:uncharacterized protein C3orf38 homolog [Rana temporaria]